MESHYKYFADVVLRISTTQTVVNQRNGLSTKRARQLFVF